MSPRHSQFRMSTIFAACLALLTPWLVGQGCNDPIPIGVSPGPKPAEGNEPPLFVFTRPSLDIIATVGDTVRISWIDEDPDNNAVITLLLDPDDRVGNGNEILAAPLILEDVDDNPQTGEDHIDLDTGALGLEERAYNVVARVNDGVNPELVVVATGQLDMRARFLPPNVAPNLVLTEPTRNLGLGQGDTFTIEYCGNDPDDDSVDPLSRGYTPEIVLMLDLDTDPTNDLDLTGADAEENLAAACYGDDPFPRDIGGALVLGCFLDDDCQDPANATAEVFEVNIPEIPPLPGGGQYNVRGTMWDHLNQPVHDYATGRISITGFATSTVVDLANIGRELSGSVFLGTEENGLTGSSATGVDDINGDGISDFVIVSRYGQSYERQNVGSAYLVMGLPAGQEFANEIEMTKLTTLYDGTFFTMPDVYQPEDVGLVAPLTGETEGIFTVNKLGDVTGDGAPEIIFGMPFIETFYDRVDDDPCDEDDSCYSDDFPNPLSTGANCDVMGAFDHREGSFEVDVEGQDEPMLVTCANDFDPFKETPISGGYVVMVSSENSLDSSIISLNLVGQAAAGVSPEGARFRGGWYPFTRVDFTSVTDSPLSIDAHNDFGRTVTSAPPMFSQTFGQDETFGTELIISAPNGEDGKGFISYIFGQDFSSFDAEGDCAVQSIPVYFGVCPGGRGLVYPGEVTMIGEQKGDYFGYASGAGDFNRDGSRDILAGAPGADRDGLVDNGIVYVILGRPDFPDFEIGQVWPHRLEIHGTRSGDRFGRIQQIIGDVNADGIDDIAIASPYHDGAGADAGFVGILFGGRQFQAEISLTVDQIGSTQLPGVQIFGRQAGAQAGSQIANVGDFNGDNKDDLLILAKDEIRQVNGQTRRGVAYLVFGGRHLSNGPLSLAQIGTDALPGMVFVSPFQQGTADEAPIDSVAGVGDINGDGFADIMLGTSEADFVWESNPSVRAVDAGRAYLIYGSNVGGNNAGVE